MLWQPQERVILRKMAEGSTRVVLELNHEDCLGTQQVKKWGGEWKDIPNRGSACADTQRHNYGVFR